MCHIILEGCFHVNRIGNVMWKRVTHLSLFCLTFSKISSENFISLNAPVGKTNSPESVPAVGSFRKHSFGEMASGKGTQMYNQNAHCVTCHG